MWIGDTIDRNKVSVVMIGPARMYMLQVNRHRLGGRAGGGELYICLSEGTGCGRGTYLLAVGTVSLFTVHREWYNTIIPALESKYPYG